MRLRLSAPWGALVVVLVRSAAALSVALSSACVAADPKPTERGSWRLSWDASFASVEVKDAVDSDSLTAAGSVGYFIDPRVMLEVAAAGTIDNEKIGDSEVRTFLGMLGVRYYPVPTGPARPYLGGRFGGAAVDATVLGVTDRASGSAGQVLGGVDLFLTESAVLDFGVRAGRVFGLDLFGSSEDLEFLAVFAGVGVYF